MDVFGGDAVLESRVGGNGGLFGSGSDPKIWVGLDLL